MRDWAAQGGGLMMIGGYFSFQGIDGRARWRRTPVEDALPVTCLPYDDRVEAPEGIIAEVLEARSSDRGRTARALAGSARRQ